MVQNILNQFPFEYSKKWHEMMYNKLGIISPNKEDKLLVKELLVLMENYQADYTNTFASLTLNRSFENSLFLSKRFKVWKQ